MAFRGVCPEEEDTVICKYLVGYTWSSPTNFATVDNLPGYGLLDEGLEAFQNE